MAQNKSLPWVWIGVAIVVVVTTLSVMYGQGQLNFGALNMQPGQRGVPRVATNVAVQCPDGTTKEDPYCVYTLQPLEYYVSKDGNNFDIYGPKVGEIFTANNWNFEEGRVFNGAAYSVSAGQFTPMTLSFKLLVKGGNSVPAFVFDYATAQLIQGSRFVEVALPNSLKIRFATFNIPDKNLNNR